MFSPAPLHRLVLLFALSVLSASAGAAMALVGAGLGSDFLPRWLAGWLIVQMLLWPATWWLRPRSRSEARPRSASAASVGHTVASR